MARIPFALSLALTGACINTAGHDEADADDLGSLLEADSDLDGNGFDDVEQTTIAAATEMYGAVMFVRPGPILPGGIADGQPLEIRGDGCNAYTDDSNCWSEGFMGMSPIYDSETGALAWYAVGGLREGNYELTCAREDAQLGTLNGWCLPGEGQTASDVHDLVVYVRDGQEGCYRDSAHWVFRVTTDWVEPLGYSIAPRDESCLE